MTAFNNLIDVQVNGFGGNNFSSNSLTVDDVLAVSTLLREKGTLAYVPTLVTIPKPLYKRNIAIIKQAIDQFEICNDMIIGIHIEGPFISPENGARGVHDARYVCAADRLLLDDILEAGGQLIKMLTVAPEVSGITEIISMAIERGIVVSMGHTLATAKQIERAIVAGARCVTHLGNGIPSQLPRTDNPIFSFLSFEELTVMLITDGHHVPDPFIRSVIRACGIDRIVVTSDAAPLAGMPPGNYVSLGGNVVLQPDGKLFNPTEGCLAGSSACIADCAAYLMHHAILNEDEVLKVTRDNPAKLIGLS